MIVEIKRSYCDPNFHCFICNGRFYIKILMIEIFIIMRDPPLIY